MAVPHISSVIEATTTLAAIRQQIEREPLIDSSVPTGLKLQASNRWQPCFDLDNVTFAYPSRPHVKAIDGVSISLPPGKFTAIVGPSGSGKSSVAALLIREYDPETANVLRDVDVAIKQHFAEVPKESKDKGSENEGQAEFKQERDSVSGGGVIRFAGHDVRDLNLQWLRQQVAVVSQNPQLFSGTILDNVASGLTGTPLEYRPDLDKARGNDEKESVRVTEIRARCEEALVKAQAWDFVAALPEGMDTIILGGRTGVLSGGQLQRVALARALVSRPKCLLLDEATSAVASDAEMRIKEMLEEEQQRRGLTLVVIAHRLSSIASADNIIVMRSGKVVNQGTYEQLIDPQNPEDTFRNMVYARHVNEKKAGSLSKVTIHKQTGAVDRLEGDFATNGSFDVPVTVQRDVLSILGPPLGKAKAVFKRNAWLILVGTVTSLMGGASFAITGWLTGEAVNSLSIPNNNPLMRSEMNRWALWFFVLALADLVVFFAAAFTLEYAGLAIKTTLTKESLRAVLRQDTSFFETDAGGSGTLTSSISEYPGAVGHTTGIIWLQIVVAFANLVASFILGFVLGWRLAILGLPTMAVCIIAGYFNFTWLEKFEALVTKEGETRSNYINESVNSIRTIAALTRESETMRRFRAAAQQPREQQIALVIGSIGFGVNQGVIYLFGALVFWWGARLLAKGQIVSAGPGRQAFGYSDIHFLISQQTITALFAVSESIFIATMTSGRVLTFAGDISRTTNALKNVQVSLFSISHCTAS
jgi:ATP-binding cassette subfamily B (MDR/TAP) protein 1